MNNKIIIKVFYTFTELLSKFIQQLTTVEIFLISCDTTRPLTHSPLISGV